MPATRSCVALRPKHDRWVNQSTPKYSTLPKFGFIVCVAHPDPAKRGGRTSSRAAGRAAVDVSSAVADASCRVGQWIEPSPVSDLQAALYERRFVLRSPLGRSRDCLRTAKPCGPGRRRYGQVLAEAALASTGAVSVNSASAREARRNSAPGRAWHKPSDHCAGKAVCSATPVCCCAVSLRYIFAQQTAGASRHPAFPAPFPLRA